MSDHSHVAEITYYHDASGNLNDKEMGSNGDSDLIVRLRELLKGAVR